jgi:hypothetical protein
VALHGSREGEQGVIRESGFTVDNHAAGEHEAAHDCGSRRTHASTLWNHIAASQHKTDRFLPQGCKRDPHGLDNKVTLVAGDGVSAFAVDLDQDTLVFSHHRDEFVVNI